MRAVNLLPRDEAKRSFEAKRGVVFGGVGGAALATVVLASMMISAGGSASSKQDELDALRAQIAAIPAVPVVDTSEEDALAAEKGARVGALSAALSGRVAWDRVLRQVSLVLPEDVWLTNLSAAAPGRDAGGRHRLRLHAHGRHLLAERRRTLPLPARGGPRPRERAPPVEPEPAGERARARPVHDPRRRPGAGAPPRAAVPASAQVPTS